MKTVKDNENKENKDDKIIGERKDEDSKEENDEDLVLGNYLIYMCMKMYVDFSSYGVIEFLDLIG